MKPQVLFGFHAVASRLKARADTVEELFINAAREERHDARMDKLLATAKEKGIRIFALGVGTERGAPIPYRDEFGNLKGYKKDRKGNPILSQTKGSVLKNLANVGEGTYYQLTFGGNAVGLLRDDIDRLKKAEFENKELVTYDELFQIPLGFSIFLLLLSYDKSEEN